MTDAKHIQDYSEYNAGMKKSLLDKIFFMDKIDANVIVDYGCADGTLIHFLYNLFPEFTYIGYDIDTTMLTHATAKFKKETLQEKHVCFTNDWDVVEECIQGRSAALLLSSIIHEVYAYGTRKDVEEFWQRVYKSNFQYIVVRDMIPSHSVDKQSDLNDVRAIMRKANSGMLRDFQKIWGTIEQNKNLVHFLLKYRYTENWEREVHENYFPMTREAFISAIPPDTYDIEFHEHFILPFLKNVVRADFGILLKDNTHLKIILKKRE